MSVINDNIIDSLNIDVILCSIFFSATLFLSAKIVTRCSTAIFWIFSLKR